MSRTDGERRARTSQLTYTCLESVLAMRLLAGTLPQIDLARPSPADDLLEFSTGFLGFHAHAGRIRDQIKKLGTLWKVEGRLLEHALEEFYQERNTVLHGPKVPLVIVEGVTAILIPAGADATKHRWDDKRSLWANADSLERADLTEYLEETVRQLLQHLESALSRVRGKVEEFLSGLGIKGDLGCSAAPSEGDPPCSGFVPPPSGQR